MIELSPRASLRTYRLEASYTAARLSATEDTEHLAREFSEAADRIRLLEEELVRLDARKVQTQAALESADDAWDDEMQGFRRRLLELCDNDVDAELFRRYFADVPSSVTELSYGAEVMISLELEESVAADGHPDLSALIPRLAEKRGALEVILKEALRVEVDEARYVNRVAMAKAIVNKLRRVAVASLEEIAMSRRHSRLWTARFFLDHQELATSLRDEDLLDPDFDEPRQLEASFDSEPGE
ncbi:MAG: hypothetical protein AAF851_20500 [Myxococcota bacterium]